MKSVSTRPTVNVYYFGYLSTIYVGLILQTKKTLFSAKIWVVTLFASTLTLGQEPTMLMLSHLYSE